MSIRDSLRAVFQRFLGNTEVFAFLMKQDAPKRNLIGFLRANRGWVYAAVSAIAEDFSAIQLKLYQRTRDGIVDVTNAGLKPMEVLKRVNDFMTLPDLLEVHSVYMDLLGRSFWYVVPDGSGEPGEILPLPAHRVSVIKSKEKIISGFVYTNAAGKKIPFDTNEIIYFRRIDPVNPFTGAYGPAFAADISIDTWEFASKWNKNYFYNSAIPEGVLRTEQTLTEEQFKRLKEEWNSKYGGIANARKIAVLEKGLKFEPVALSPRDMDFAKLKRETRDEILGVFRVPRTVVGITDDVNRANAEATDYVFSKRVIRPRMRRFVGHLNEFYLPKFKLNGDYFFDFVDPVPEDTERAFRNYQVGVTSGFMAPNEAREKLGLPPVDGGDTVYQPMNLMPLGKVQDGKKAVVLIQGRGEVKSDNGDVRVKISKKDREKVARRRRFIAVAAKKHEKFLKAYFEQQRDYVLGKLEEFKKQKGFKSKVVKRGMESELINFIFGEGEWGKWIQLLLNPTEEFLKSLVLKGGREALDEVGVEASFDVKHPEVLRWIKKYAAREVQVIDEHTRELLRDVIFEAADLGLGPDEVAARLMDIYDGFNKYRALRIARTETAKAYSEGSMFGYRQSKVVKQVAWLTAGDSQVCPICQANADRGAISLGSDFPSGHKNPPAHPNCRCAILPVVK